MPQRTQSSQLVLEDWGLTDYQSAFLQQAQMVEARLAGRGQDTLVLTEHPPSVTLGRRGGEKDLRFPEESYPAKGIALHRVNRGGLATAHEPGQLVAYPVLQLQTRDLHLYISRFLHVVVTVLADYGLEGRLKTGAPGVWVDDRKICSFGIALKKWVTSHGIALNVNNETSLFDTIVPCGVTAEQVTSMGCELQRQVSMDEVKKRFVQHFCRVFDFTLA